MQIRVLSNEDIDALIVRGGVPSPEEFEALFARWRSLPPGIRDAEQTRLSAALSSDGRAEWDRLVWLKTCGAMQNVADEALRELNGRNIPMVDDRPGQSRQVAGSAIGFWRFSKEWWVKEAAALR